MRSPQLELEEGVVACELSDQAWSYSTASKEHSD